MTLKIYFYLYFDCPRMGLPIDWKEFILKEILSQDAQILGSTKKVNDACFFQFLTFGLTLQRETIPFLQSVDWSILCCLSPMFVSSIPLITVKRYCTLAIQLFYFIVTKVIVEGLGHSCLQLFQSLVALPVWHKGHIFFTLNQRHHLNL